MSRRRELRGEALAVPVGQQAHHDDRSLDRVRQSLSGRSAWPLSQGLDATRRSRPCASGAGWPG